MEITPNLIKDIRSAVDKARDRCITVNKKIWENPELGYKETFAASTIIDALKAEGFTVETGIADIPTAFVGSYGSGSPVIALLGEYDALPGLSQQAATATQEPIEDNAAGHGCGHNVIASGVLAAAIGAKNYLDQAGLTGTIRYYGCPSEEMGAGKMFMSRAGCFDDVDACYTYHPGSCNAVLNRSNLAVIGLEISFTGKAAHAALHPDLGRSALDACELTNVGVNYLREHVPTSSRIHYAYKDTGGTAPNVVQAHAALRYAVRALSIGDAKLLCERVINVAKGAALMTDTTVETKVTSGICEYIPNHTLGELMTEAMQAVGGPRFDDADRDLAQQFFSTYSTAEVEAAMKHIIKTSYPNWSDFLQQPLIESVAPYAPSDARGNGSTDVGDVSYVVPMAQSRVTTYANGTPNHTWQVTAQVNSPLAEKAVVTVGESIALTCVLTILRPDVVARAKEEHKKATGGKYVCPVDASVLPNL